MCMGEGVRELVKRIWGKWCVGIHGRMRLFRGNSRWVGGAVRDDARPRYDRSAHSMRYVGGWRRAMAGHSVPQRIMGDVERRVPQRIIGGGGGK